MKKDSDYFSFLLYEPLENDVFVTVPEFVNKVIKRCVIKRISTWEDLIKVSYLVYTLLGTYPILGYISLSWLSWYFGMIQVCGFSLENINQYIFLNTRSRARSTDLDDKHVFRLAGNEP